MITLGRLASREPSSRAAGIGHLLEARPFDSAPNLRLGMPKGTNHARNLGRRLDVWSLEDIEVVVWFEYGIAETPPGFSQTRCVLRQASGNRLLATVICIKGRTAAAKAIGDNEESQEKRFVPHHVGKTRSIRRPDQQVASGRPSPRCCLPGGVRSSDQVGVEVSGVAGHLLADPGGFGKGPIFEPQVDLGNDDASLTPKASSTSRMPIAQNSQIGNRGISAGFPERPRAQTGRADSKS